MIKMCLRKGASMNLRNTRGNTALHYAFGFGYHDQGEYLRGKGANDSILNCDGLTCYEGLTATELEHL